MNPHRLVYGFAYNFPFVAITAGVTIVAWLVSKERKHFPWTTETILEILLCLWITVTTFFAYSPFAWDYWNRAIKVQVMIFLTLFIMQSRERLVALIWTIVLSIGFFGVKGGIWTILHGGSFRVQGPEKSFIEGNNEIALALVMVLPLMHYLQLYTSAKWAQRGLIGAQILTTLSVVATYSRAGFLALCAVAFLLWLKSRHKLALAVAMVVIAVPIVKFMPDEWGDRMRTVQNTDEEDMDGSARGRLNAWRFALALAEDRPITGGGFRVFISPLFYQYAPDPYDRHDAHSIYFETLAEHGFPGLLIFLGLGLSTWVTARRVRRISREMPELTWASDMVSMVQVGLAGYAVGGAFAGLAFFDLPYHLMAIVVLCHLLIRNELRAVAQRELDQVPAVSPDMNMAPAT